jgi:hypothetical protein
VKQRLNEGVIEFGTGKRQRHSRIVFPRLLAVKRW